MDQHSFFADPAPDLADYFNADPDLALKKLNKLPVPYEVFSRVKRAKDY